VHQRDEAAHAGDDDTREGTDRRAEEQDARLACAHERAHGGRDLEDWQAPARGGGLLRTEHQRDLERRALLGTL
jgi:hypothetical protein